MADWTPVTIRIKKPKDWLVEQGILVEMEGESDYQFRFNNFIKIPKRVKETSVGTASSRGIRALALFGDDLDKELAKSACLISPSFKEDYEKEWLQKEDLNPKQTDVCGYNPEMSYLEYGRHLMRNTIDYGHPHWWDWTTSNWGVKWDFSQMGADAMLDETIVYGEIVWGVPDAPFAKLASLIKADVEVVWTDYEYIEETDSLVGTEITKTFKPNGKTELEALKDED